MTFRQPQDKPYKWKQLRFKAYKFDQLPKEAKEKALDKYRQINVDNENWNDYIIEEFTDVAKKKGYDNTDFRYSGFWSQGDGASFEAHVDALNWIKKNRQTAKYPALVKFLKDNSGDFKIEQSGNYYHSNTMHIDGYLEHASSLTEEEEKLFNEADKEWNVLEEEILTKARDLADTYYKKLEEGYNAETSDETISDTFTANEYEFNEKGDIV